MDREEGGEETNDSDEKEYIYIFLNGIYIYVHKGRDTLRR